MHLMGILNIQSDKMEELSESVLSCKKSPRTFSYETKVNNELVKRKKKVLEGKFYRHFICILLNVVVIVYVSSKFFLIGISILCLL